MLCIALSIHAQKFPCVSAMAVAPGKDVMAPLACARNIPPSRARVYCSFWRMSILAMAGGRVSLGGFVRPNGRLGSRQ
jgi:hypothetical protein